MSLRWLMFNHASDTVMIHKTTFRHSSVIKHQGGGLGLNQDVGADAELP